MVVSECFDLAKWALNYSFKSFIVHPIEIGDYSFFTDDRFENIKIRYLHSGDEVFHVKDWISTPDGTVFYFDEKISDTIPHNAPVLMYGDYDFE